MTEETLQDFTLLVRNCITRLVMLERQRAELTYALRETLQLARQSLDEEEWNTDIFRRARAALASVEANR